MPRIILTILLTVVLTVLTGCNGDDTGKSQLISTREKLSSTANINPAREVDLVEQMANDRSAYRQDLEALIDHYTMTGNDMKLAWAKKELKAADTMPQYDYIIEAGLAGPNLKPTSAIPEADDLYYDARKLEKDASVLLIFKDEKLLRVALDKYNLLIKKYPSSDKIDLAAYRAAKISEHFKDYTIALLYYQRVYQWNPETKFHARFKAAYILDRKLHRREEALELYREAVKRDLPPNYENIAELRIFELTKSDETD